MLPLTNDIKYSSYPSNFQKMIRVYITAEDIALLYYYIFEMPTAAYHETEKEPITYLVFGKLTQLSVL
jgi:hypothetical protein